MTDSWRDEPVVKNEAASNLAEAERERRRADALQRAIEAALRRIVLSDDSSVSALIDVTDILRAAVGAVPETRDETEKQP